MTSEEELIQTLRNAFDSYAKELSLSFTFEEFDSTFFIQKTVLRQQYVGDIFLVLSESVVNTYMSWHSYLQGLVFPQSSNMSSVEESQLFLEEEKKEFKELMRRSLYISSQQVLLALDTDTKLRSAFLHKAFEDWNTYYKPKITAIMTKVSSHWETAQKSSSQKEQQFDGYV